MAILITVGNMLSEAKKLKIKLIFSFLFLSIPIFISIQKNHVGGAFLGYNLLFSANPKRVFDIIPILPLSQYWIFILAIAYRKYLIRERKLIIAFLLALPSIVLVGIYQESKVIIPVLIIVVQTFNFLLAQIIFQRFIPNSYTIKDLTQVLFTSMVIVFVVKFISDMFIYKGITQYFIFHNIYIYNFADYFAVFYLLLVYVSLCFFLHHSSSFLKILALGVMILSCWSVFMMLSKVIMVILILSLFSSLYIYFSRISKQVNYIIITTGLISFMVCFCAVLFLLNGSFENTEVAFAVRSEKISIFFSNLDFSNIVFPSISKGREILQKGLHNEYLEIYSAVGLPFFVFFYTCLWRTLRQVFFFENHMGIVLVFLVFMAGNIQLNLLQSYSGILIGAIIGCFIKITQNTIDQESTMTEKLADSEIEVLNYS